MSEQDRDKQWEAAMTDATLANTPIDLRMLANAAKQAMLETADSLTPSDQTARRAWERLQQQAEAKGMFQERQRWLDWILVPRRLAFAFALTLAAGISIIWWATQQADRDIVVVAMRGDAWIVTVSDADAETPTLVKELRALKLAPKVTRLEDGTRVDVQWPVPASREASAWLADKNFHLSPDGKLHLYLVKHAR